ncbi:diacylglycerol/lipid kinase family protein [Slackia heliotrinireducens]|uniref:diacylglycerol/lipid kinase family protein n=1 Tax=Slackia heliotrinireducens TaxID=84110 RepID=UPI003315F619
MHRFGRVLVVANPAAQNGVGARRIASLRQAENALPETVESLQVVATEHAGHARELGAGSADFDTLIALGGDGVIHEVLNGVMTLPEQARPVFGILPCGNGNDLARTLRIPFDQAGSLAALSRARVVPYDIGNVNGEWFIETLSFGFDAAIAIGTHTRRMRTGHTGTRLYLEEGAEQLLRKLRPYTYTASVDGGEPRRGGMLMFAVQNGPTYGGGWRICPDADPTDGRFDICRAVPPLANLHAAALFLRAKSGGHVNSPHVRMERATALDIAFDEAPAAQADGEKIEGSTFHVTMHPGALRVLAGEGAAF